MTAPAKFYAVDEKGEAIGPDDHDTKPAEYVIEYDDGVTVTRHSAKNVKPNPTWRDVIGS